jgi:hypothetical protein
VNEGGTGRTRGRCREGKADDALGGIAGCEEGGARNAGGGGGAGMVE